MMRYLNRVVLVHNCYGFECFIIGCDKSSGYFRKAKKKIQKKHKLKRVLRKH